MNDSPEFNPKPNVKSLDAYDDATPEYIDPVPGSETILVRGMSRAVDQTRQLLPPITTNPDK